MPELVLIANSGPLIALAGVGQLGLLPALYRQILIPRAVAAEIRAGGPCRTDSALIESNPWMTLVTASWPPQLKRPLFLGLGETEVLALGLADPKRLLLLDDYRARRTASDLQLQATGTAGVLVRAKREGHISAVTPLIESMRTNGYYIAQSVLAEVRRRAGE